MFCHHCAEQFGVRWLDSAFERGVIFSALQIIRKEVRYKGYGCSLQKDNNRVWSKAVSSHSTPKAAQQICGKCFVIIARNSLECGGLTALSNGA